MGSIQFTAATGALATFYEVCASTGVRDWRAFCKEGLLNLITTRITDEGWQNRYFDAIIGGGQFNFEHRPPSEMELGGTVGSCDFTTYSQFDFETCQIKVPDLQLLRVGIEAHDEKYWEQAYCRKYGLNGGFKSPFVYSGNQITLRIDPDSASEEQIRFGAWIFSQLYHALGQHLFRTLFLGRKENVDEFDGFLRLIENGNESIGECRYPLKPAVIDFGFLVTGIEGARVSPASRVPDDHPPVTIFAGTVKETVFPVAGKDLIDILTSWKNNVVTSDWGYEIPAGAWGLWHGQEQDECITRLAGCKQYCVEGGCATMFMNPPQQVVDRAADYINNKSIALWPNPERIGLNASRILAEKGWIYFTPRMVQDGTNGTIDLWSFVMRNMNRQDQNLASDWNLPIDDRFSYGVTVSPNEFQLAHPDHQQAIESFPDVVFRVMKHQPNPYCYGLTTKAEGVLVMECPEVQLLIKGVDCDTQPTRVCPEVYGYTDINLEEDFATIAPGVGFLSAVSVFIEPMAPIRIGDPIWYRTAYGSSYEGVVRTYDAATGELEIDFLEAGITVLIHGGPGTVGFLPNVGQVYTRFIRTCSGGPAVFAVTFDNGTPLVAVPGARVLVTSALGASSAYGSLTSVVSAAATDTSVTVTLTAAPAADCEWDTLPDATTVPLSAGGSITIRLP